MKICSKIFMAVILAIYITGSCHAGTVTENGVTLTTGSTGKVNPVKFWSAIVALNADPTGTPTYNQAGESGATSGSINCKRYGNKNINVQIKVATLNSTSISVDIELIHGIGTSWSHVYTKTFTSTTTKDYQFPVQEEPYRIRISTESSGDVADDDITVTVTGEGSK